MELRMQYATAQDGVRIAFGTAGRGPYLVRVPSLPFAHSQLDWEKGSDFYEQLAQNWTVVQFDPRGVGLSDRDIDDFSIEKRVLDIEAVYDKLGIESAPLHGIGWSAPPAITFAVRNPERVTHLILDDAQVKIEEFMAMPQVRALDQLLGEWDTFLEYVAYTIYGFSREQAKPVIEFMKASVSQEGALKIYASLRGDDVSDLLPQVTQPTLVLQHTGGSAQVVETARRAAALIPDSRLVLLEGQAADSTDRIIAAVAEFLGVERAETSRPSAAPESGVRAILFTDVVDHTAVMSRLGDERGREVLREHESMTRRLLAEHGGSEVKSLGDGFMASFGSVARAVECAIGLQRAFAERNEKSDVPVNVRVGINAGEPIEEGAPGGGFDLFGATVILASRIAHKAEGGEILVANTVRELCAGKGFLFSDRGDFIAKGFEDPLRIFEVRWRE